MYNNSFATQPEPSPTDRVCEKGRVARFLSFLSCCQNCEAIEMVHFSGSRVQSGEIEFSPNPFPSTSFKDDTILAKRD